MQDNIINNKYLIQNHIGSGKFGNVFNGIYKKTNERIAIKVEDINAPFQLLKHEAKIMNMLNINHCKYIPTVFWFGKFQNAMCLIIPYYSCSLEQYIKIKQINNSQLNYLMIQMINILESIHTNCVIHRDIKPQNFMIKSGDLYLIDFGLSTFYINQDSCHIPNKHIDDIIGNVKYVSYNIHNGHLPSRRDDLISIGYIYIYLHNHKLEWDNIIINKDLCIGIAELSNYKNEKRKEFKSWGRLSEVCSNIQNQYKMNSECDKIKLSIYEYMQICYQYDYDELPNYNEINNIFN